MTEPRIAPYGSWKSPISSELIVAGTIGLGGIRLEGDTVYWTEQRPTEGGRNVVVRRSPDGTVVDVTPAPFNVRSRVHEYGGGAYFVQGGAVYFSNFADQRLYRQMGDAAPIAITPETQWRYADGGMDAGRDRIICVREDHTGDGEPINTIVAIDASGSQEQVVLVSGCDFYLSPRLSPDGSQLAWISWNHPDMPWDNTELWVAAIAPDGTLTEPQKVAGGTNESVIQPVWSPDGTLYFLSDRTNWWNLYRWTASGEIEALCPMEAEFGMPPWVFGYINYGFVASDRLVCVYSQDGLSHFAALDTHTKALTEIPLPYTELGGIQVAGQRVVFQAGTATAPGAIVQFDLATERLDVLQQSSTVAIDPGYLSQPQPLTFPTTDGAIAYGFYYPPTNQDYTAPPTERPPLLVKSHGGPTAATSTAFNLKIQYWTSRGFAVLDVDYRGSTGYGRAYRDALKGQWGIVDVDDCANGATYLVEQGLVDGDRLVIDGGSAGGYTTLSALTFRDVFKAGASYYGVSDLEVLATDTHKFEARYLDSLIGPYPDRKDLYIARSPIHFTAQLNCPVIFFQGDEDKIVPPNQAELMVNALRDKGLPVAYVLYEGEQHGFRKAENIKRTLDGEFYFYAQLFGFSIADEIQPVFIENLASN
mgnify:CR=1 FL=1